MANLKDKKEEKDYFLELLKKNSIVLEDQVVDRLLKYMNIVYEKNKVMNLTAIREKDEILEKHFIDSLLLMGLIHNENKQVIDVGTGAGFPGLVLAIVYPEKQFLLVDSVRKKVEFLNEVMDELEIENVITSSERAEELIKDRRESFDIALCRGVAKLRIIVEYMIPFLKVKGRFLAQKLTVDEIPESQNALNTLNAEIVKTHIFKLPTIRDERVIIEIVKKKETSHKYPRKVGVPSKKPL